MTESEGKLVHAGEAFIHTQGEGTNAMVFKDSLGVIILGLLVLILIIALERAHARNRKLMAQLQQNKA